MTITQAQIDALNARLTPADRAAIASDWQAVGDDLRTVMDSSPLYPWNRPGEVRRDRLRRALVERLGRK